MALQVKRVFTEHIGLGDYAVYDMFNWKKVDVLLKDHKTGKIIYEGKELYFPEHFSQQACDIIASKYFFKGEVNETSYQQVVHRMVNFWTDALVDENILDKKDAKIFYDEVAFMMISQMFAPNSPQWFNTGIREYTYGSKNGHYYFDENLNKVVESDDSYSRSQTSACFILNIEDKLLGDKSITDAITTETRLFKMGSGVGSNWGKLRAKGEPLANGGVSSGVMSFIKVSDRNAGAIKSGGTTRRAAKMVCINDTHPELMEFIKWKSTEEDKVRALGKMGYDISFESEAYETVSGQNVNTSICLSDNTMSLASSTTKDEYVELCNITDNKVVAEIKAKDILTEMATACHNCGDPNPIFIDTMNAWHTCPCGEDGKYTAKHNRINSTNPCGEYAFLDDTACNLASFNLVKFLDEDTRRFDLDKFNHACMLASLVLEASIHWGHFPTEEIARKSYMFRPVGLGYANAHTMLMMMGLAYNSEEARQTLAYITNMLTAMVYNTSANMAREIGAFKAFDINKEHILKVLNNHFAVANSNIDFNNKINYSPKTIDYEKFNSSNFYYDSDYLSLEELARNVWYETIELGSEVGFRNAQATVIAPTGTISLAMDCPTSSIEPIFSHIMYKILAGGGIMKIINPSIKSALEALGLNNETILNILQDLEKEKYSIENCPVLTKSQREVFRTASGENALDADAHLLMLASLAPNISGSISKTINLPSTVTVDEIVDIMIRGWKLGIKGFTIYRDNSKACQPLITSLEKDETLTYAELLDFYKENKNKELSETDIKHQCACTCENKCLDSTQQLTRIKPQGIRNAHLHHVKVDGIDLYIEVVYYENEIREIFARTGKVGNVVSGLIDSLAINISRSLQYGVPPVEIAKGLANHKFEPSGIVTYHPYIKMCDSISDLLARIIEIELGDYSRCQVKPAEKNDNATEMINSAINLASKVVFEKSNTKKNEAREKVYGEVCTNCGSDKLVRAGSCKVCPSCGTTTGCS